MIVISYTALTFYLSTIDANRNVMDLVENMQSSTSEIYINLNEFLNGNSYYDPLSSINEFESDLTILKNGGTKLNTVFPPLQPEFSHDYDLLAGKFSNYKTLVIREIQKHEKNMTLNKNELSVINNVSRELNVAADSLHSHMRTEDMKNTQYFVKLQILFLLLNVLVHLLLIYLILKVLSTEAKKNENLLRLSSIGELAARLAHDLRNPLSVIKNTFEIIKLNMPSDEKTLERFDRIDRAISRISYQVDNVLDFVRVGPTKKRQENMLDIIENALSMIRIPDSVTLESPSKNVMVTCDSELMEIVFINLIKNALQAMNNVGTIKIGLTGLKKQVTITVENSGPPIPSTHLDKIFEPLFTTKQEGTGLGLSSCKNIVENHGGHISVKNNPTTFVITLPSE